MGNAVAKVCADTDDDGTDATDVSVYEDAPGNRAAAALSLSPSARATAAPFNQSPALSLASFELVRTIGNGSFGRVMLVRRLSEDKQYALKYISKAQCIKQNAVRNVINERKILEKLMNPLLCNMQAAFQDDEHMYLVLDWMGGGDLAVHLDRKGHFAESIVRCHVAEIAIAMDYLHRKKIVHRDIKPANVLLDEQGHCHLTDFNVAGRIHAERAMQTVAGTYNYIAPEVFQKSGYNESVDWWSLGVTMFECLYGKCPFRGKSRADIKEAVLKHKITYPKKFKPDLSRECEAALAGFLESEPEKRLSGAKTANPWRNHPWFAILDLDAMEKLMVIAPFIPEKGTAENNKVYEVNAMLGDGDMSEPLKQKKPSNSLLSASSSRAKEEAEEGSPWKLMKDEFKDFDRSKISVVKSPVTSHNDSPTAKPFALAISGIMNGKISTDEDIHNIRLDDTTDPETDSRFRPTNGVPSRRMDSELEGNTPGFMASGDEDTNDPSRRPRASSTPHAANGSSTSPRMPVTPKSHSIAAPLDSDDPEYRDDPVVSAALGTGIKTGAGTAAKGINSAAKKRFEEVAAARAAAAKAAQEDRVKAVLAGLAKNRRPSVRPPMDEDDDLQRGAGRKASVYEEDNGVRAVW